ncbi:head GIN domain-containing protein [Brevundimonas sp.]|uniref:head GIN domain-containing protein n=1 Tax=Brevundimonas sp. TaxID=1871086 RepID=UPI002D2E004B|nr:head GIN domain-containing protein [Brevundimonas sp.]HYD27556.1 head GIN domain-containing protein [Brevundimonas sp.]
MIRTLLIITGASLVLCAASLGGAAALGGNDLARHGWSWTFRDDGHDETVRFERADDGPSVTRTLAWTGGDRLDVEVAADVTYVQGDEASVVVTGPRNQVEGLRLSDGRLTFDNDDNVEVVVFGWHNTDRLRITVTAPSVRNFSLSSSGDLQIRNYDQPDMMLTIQGSGDVTAAGRTEAVELDIHGSGEADLSALETRDADVEISGSGEAAVGPTGGARISISGSGDVELTRRPASVTQNISGSGDVYQR